MIVKGPLSEVTKCKVDYVYECTHKNKHAHYVFVVNEINGDSIIVSHFNVEPGGWQQFSRFTLGWLKGWSLVAEIGHKSKFPEYCL
jgi:hypothetical protein